MICVETWRLLAVGGGLFLIVFFGAFKFGEVYGRRNPGPRHPREIED